MAKDETVIDSKRGEVLKTGDAILASRGKIPSDYHRAKEIRKCMLSPAYFINTYCKVLDGQKWVPFELWPEQFEALDALEQDAQYHIWLKARQIGMTWLVLAFALHQMMFWPITRVMFFSKRETDAKKSLQRAIGMYKLLPIFLREYAPLKYRDVGKYHIELRNGSEIMSLPSTAGDSYTAEIVIIDEADVMPNFEELLLNVEPAMEAGGKLIALSKSSKDKPQSLFKQIFRAAIKKADRTPKDWHPLFLPFDVHPARDMDWWRLREKREMNDNGNIDNLLENYPRTPADALKPLSGNKRIAGKLLTRAFAEAKPISPADMPETIDAILTHEAVRVYELPQKGVDYCMGGDTAEGNPNSDDSTAVILNKKTGDIVCILQGKIEPTAYAGMCGELMDAYNQPVTYIEDNNHGYSVIQTMQYNGYSILTGEHGKPGWRTTKKTKAMLYVDLVSALQANELTICDANLYYQLLSIESGTLSAPEKMHDDLAMAYVLAVQAQPYETSEIEFF